MKMKYRTACLAGILAVIFLTALTGLAQEDTKTVSDSGFKTNSRPVVPFLHDQHNEKAKIDECQTCHHTFKDGKKDPTSSSEDQKCSECHLDKNKGSMDLIKTYHDRCKGCHLEKKAGPITCGECHPRK